MLNTTLNPGVTPASSKVSASPVNPEVNALKRRRLFTASYKLKILDELDRCSIVGEKGAILRREGLYTSQITEWKRLRDQGALTALNKVRGCKKKSDSKDQMIDELKKENELLKGKLTQAETIIDVQKKISEILGISQEPTDYEKESS